MAVDTQHKDYQATAPLWEKCRDVFAGQEAVHKAGKKYLPILDGQETAQYEAYRDRATFYNASARTLDGLSGLIFRKDPSQDLPTGMQDWVTDVTMSGLGLRGFAEELVEQIIKVNRAGILVDFPRDTAGVITKAQAQAAGLRPFTRLYTAESIIDWRTGVVNNITQLTQVRLMETHEVEGADFEVESFPQIRVLTLVGGVYTVQLYRQNEANDWEPVYEKPIVPLMRGKMLKYIPFVFANDQDTSWLVRKPVLLDLVNLNLSHYRTTADLEHGAHYCGLPTPYCFGMNEDDAPNGIGPGVLWTSSDPETKAGFVEFTGQGLQALEKRLEVKESQMASLGARMLAPEKRQAEAAETHAIKQSGEHSILASIADSCSDAITQALEIARDWMGLSGEVDFRLNKDFLPYSMSPEMLKQLLAAVQAGKLSFTSYFENLQRGEIIRGDKTADEEQAEIQTDGSVVSDIG